MKSDTKPYDTAFKDLAEQSPELLLQLVGALPPDATVTVLPREVSSPIWRPISLMRSSVRPNISLRIGFVAQIRPRAQLC